MQHNSLYQILSAGTRRLALMLCLWVPGVFAADSALKPLNVLILSPRLTLGTSKPPMGC